MSDLLSIEEALDLVLARVSVLTPEDVPLASADGRVLAVEAPSVVDLPPFAASAMDGFAIRSVDVPATLEVVGRIAAGSPAAQRLEAGQAMSIATGAVVPDGADAVVPIEDVDDRGASVVVQHVLTGANVRPRGGDLRSGDEVVGHGVKLGPIQVGALAAAGVATVSVHRRPRVVIAVTGSELRETGSPLGPGEIYDANGFILAAQVRSTGATVERVPPVRDNPEATRAAVAAGLDADVLITSGGVSVGIYDLVRESEAELGVEEVFWRVAVRPGKPVAFGVRGNTLVFGLPGNPVSSLVGFELFVRPALLALQGLRDPRPAYRPGVLATPAKLVGRRSLLRARAHRESDGMHLELLRGQESHMIARAATADALVLVPAGDGELQVGTPVVYLPI